MLQGAVLPARVGEHVPDPGLGPGFAAQNSTTKEVRMPDLLSFATIELDFMRRVQEVVWCNCATIDAQQRPRSRVVHPIWEGTTGWITTRRSSPKIKHLAANPFVSLAYIADPFRPCYVECHAIWDDDLATRARIWEWCRNTPPPMGFDPAAVWGDIADPENGLLRLTAWRIELNDFSGPPQTTIWRAKDEQPAAMV